MVFGTLYAVALGSDNLLILQLFFSPKQKLWYARSHGNDFGLLTLYDCLWHNNDENESNHKTKYIF
jgi:hypothetical protein